MNARGHASSLNGLIDVRNMTKKELVLMVQQLQHKVGLLSDSAGKSDLMHKVARGSGGESNNKLEFSALEKRAKKLYSDAYAPLWLAVLDELLLQKAPVWFSSNEGYYLTSAIQVHERLALAYKKHNRDCRRNSGLLFMCVITKNDDVDLQEWIVWQIIILGAQHVLVYLNDPLADNSLTVLKPFVEAGFVTIFNMTGTDRQKDAYPHCIELIKRKTCRYVGYGPLTPANVTVPVTEAAAGAGASGFHVVELGVADADDCRAGEDMDVFLGKDRPVWMAGFDSDEFAIATDDKCYLDILQQYANYNGLMIPWLCFGHSNKFLTPRDQLVTEAYTHRMWGGGGFDKAFNRVFSIKKMTNSHVAIFRDGKFASDEFFKLTNYEKAPEYNFTEEVGRVMPKYRLHHYMTKSVEHLVKKWSRGVADRRDEWGRALKRPLEEIIGWFSGYATVWNVQDENALPLAKIVRTVLTGD